LIGVSGNWLGLKSGENGSSPTRRSGILMDPIVLSGIGMIILALVIEL
jgi:hypothetical protein